MLKARAQAAQAQQQLQSAVGNIGTNSAMAAFERMEEKVEAMEATGQAAAELAGADLESQFAALEGGSDVDDELAALRNQLGAVNIRLLAQGLQEERATGRLEQRQGAPDLVVMTGPGPADFGRLAKWMSVSSRSLSTSACGKRDS